MKAKDLAKFLKGLADLRSNQGNKDEADALRKLAKLFEGRNQNVADFVKDVRQSRKL